MTLPDALLVNGTSLASLTGVYVEDLASLHAPGARRGDDLTVPGLTGDVYIEKVYASYSFTIPVTIVGEDSTGSMSMDPHERRAQYVTNLRALAALVDNGLLTFTRRLAVTGGGYEDMTASGRYFDGLAVGRINDESASALLQFVNLDGCWTDGMGAKHL